MDGKTIGNSCVTSGVDGSDMFDMPEKRSSSDRAGAVLSDVGMCVTGQSKAAADAQPQSGLDDFMSLRGEAHLQDRHQWSFTRHAMCLAKEAQSKLLINSMSSRSTCPQEHYLRSGKGPNASLDVRNWL